MSHAAKPMALEREEVTAKRWVDEGVVLCAVAAAVLLSWSAAYGGKSLEEKCNQGLYKHKAKYIACQYKVAARIHGGGGVGYEGKLAKCTTKYRDSWLKLQNVTPGAGRCYWERFVDNGDGTVIDNLTGLQWEKKTDDDTVHDRDNAYTWSGGVLSVSAADGTAFTSFLRTLNNECFAGHCDWRLPTVAELQTILLAPYPCGTSPCIDESLFGPTAAGIYWSASPFPDSPTYASYEGYAWYVSFDSGDVRFRGKNDPFEPYVRAVRSGL